MKTIGLIILFTVLTLFDLPRLIKQKNRKDIITYSIILGAAFALSELHIFRVQIPSPDRLITDLVRMLNPFH